MEILGYFLFIVIGIVLGLIGGGGSVLGVPVLVYILGYDAVKSTGYSLFIVGVASLVGSFAYMRKGLIDKKATLTFAIPSVLVIFWVRNYFIPGLPQQFTLLNYVLSKDALIMLVFSLLLAAVSYSMIKVKQPPEEVEEKKAGSETSLLLLIASGLLIGFLSGFVGAGGGFLIIPALVFFVKLPMKLAIGTSLSIIAINSLIGFTGNLGTLEINWTFLLVISALSIAGIFIGTYLSNFVSTKKLKPAFGWFTMIVGVLVIVKEIFLK